MGLGEIFLRLSEALSLVGKFIFCFLESTFRAIVPPSMKSINGETILVTGAVGGIGKEICKQLIRSGKNLKLVLLDLNQDHLENLKNELLELGQDVSECLEVYVSAVDISTRENIDKAAEEVLNTVGPISVIFNNAGICQVKNFLQLSNEDIEKTIQINLMSHFWIIRKFLPGMAANNHGRIVNICSMSALMPVGHAAPYVASKFGVNGYTESLKLELAMLGYDGIKVSTVYPYFVRTAITNDFQLEKPSNGIYPSSMRKFLKPEDVAKSTVDGMRREYEYIYCPSIFGFLVFLMSALPLKFRKYLESNFFQMLTFKDPNAQKKYTDAYQVA